MSDSIIVMNRGVVVESGAADEVCERPQHPYTRKLIDSIPALG
jgi:oligopeptide/dipeptide ABC transporter ATP-binding protein